MKESWTRTFHNVYQEHFWRSDVIYLQLMQNSTLAKELEKEKRGY